jgi:hypothetical protein
VLDSIPHIYEKCDKIAKNLEKTMAENLTEPPKQLQIHFPPSDMHTGIAQAVVDESRKGEGPSVVVTGKWEEVRAEKHHAEIIEDIEDRRQTGLSPINR